MSSLDEEITKLHRIRKTLLHMLNDRGYLVAADEVSMTKEQLVEKYGENMKREDLFIHKEMKNNSSDQIYVFFLVPEPKKTTSAKTIGVGPIKKCIQKMMSEQVFRAILVAEEGFTPAAKKSILEMTQFTMEAFQDAELLCNVMEHDLVPEHLVVTDKEKIALLQKYRVKETQLPRMLVSDPVARHFGLKRGQVVKIIRPSENANKYVSYRCVF